MFCIGAAAVVDTALLLSISERSNWRRTADAKNQLVESFELHAITHALQNHGGNVSAAARQLGIHRQSLQQKISQLGIRVERS